MPTVAALARQEVAVEAVGVLVVEEVRSHTHRPPLPPIGTAPACLTSLRVESQLTASAASPLTTRALCPKMQTSTPSRRHQCPQTSPARYWHTMTRTTICGFKVGMSDIYFKHCPQMQLSKVMS